MITINLSRKEVYVFGAAVSLVPLMFFAACLFGVVYLQSHSFSQFQEPGKIDYAENTHSVDKTDFIEAAQPASKSTVNDALVINYSGADTDPDTNAKFSVQFASFVNQGNALHFVKELSDTIRSVQLMIKAETITPYVVIAGQYDSMSNARIAAKRYNQETMGNSFAIQLASLSANNQLAAL